MPLDAPAARPLVAELDADLARRYDDDTPILAPPDEFLPPGGLFVLATVDGKPMACAGFRRVDDATAELKRMYVRPAARGKGLARRLLAHLEQQAVQTGYTELWLETGLEQPEAIALYISAGYRPIPPFGQFSSEPDQRCYAKSLRAGTPSNRAPLS